MGGNIDLQKAKNAPIPILGLELTGIGQNEKEPK
jgi:hypothetical protein